MAARLSGRVILYVLVPCIALITPIIGLPMVTSHFGSSGWSSIATGQSWGAGAAVIIELGWGLNGPQMVAGRSLSEARAMLASSMRVRAELLLPAGLGAAACAAATTQAHVYAAGLAALGSAALGLTASWFFVGMQRPGVIVWAEALPAAMGVAAGSGAVAAGGSLWSYSALAVVLPPVCTFFVVARYMKLGLHMRGVTRSEIRAIYRHQRVAVLGRVVSASYVALPIALVSIANSSIVATFASCERLMRMTLAVLIAVPNALQGWLGRSDSKDLVPHIKRALVLSFCVGVASAFVFFLLAPFAIRLVFSGTVQAPPQALLLCSGVIALVSISRATGTLGLVAVRDIRAITISAIIGAVIAVPLIMILSRAVGVGGGFIGELIGEISVLAYQTVALRRGVRQLSAQPLGTLTHRGSEDAEVPGIGAQEVLWTIDGRESLPGSRRATQ